MENFIKSAVELLRDYVQSQFNGNISEASRSVGISEQTVYKWLKGERIPSFSKIAPFLEYVGATISVPNSSQEITKDVCFINSKIVDAGEYQNPPQVEDYLAVPVVDEVGAGIGIIPQGEFLSWFLVYKNQNAIRYRSNLIAVQIAKNSTSMIPTLAPMDIVLVDRDDREVKAPGKMYLVMDPEGAGKIKRVSIEEKNQDFRIIYYSDNTVENPPEIYSLKEDFLGKWENVIAGRVVWAWSDVSDK